jgi:hypothetical protein
MLALRSWNHSETPRREDSQAEFLKPVEQAVRDALPESTLGAFPYENSAMHVPHCLNKIRKALHANSRFKCRLLNAVGCTRRHCKAIPLYKMLTGRKLQLLNSGKCMVWQKSFRQRYYDNGVGL